MPTSWPSPPAQLPLIALPPQQSEGTKVRPGQCGPHLAEVEEEHVAGVGQVPGDGDLASDRSQLLPDMGQHTHQVVLVQLPHSDQFSDPVQREAHADGAQPAAAPNPPDHRGDRHLAARPPRANCASGARLASSSRR